jgi:phosphatidylserine/phosphatidylglycerophosphate/cardiolipin synthase-like enzyme
LTDNLEPPQVLVTGRHWLGAAGARSIGAVLIDAIASAKQEIIIVAYRLTVSVEEFTSVLESALARGCLVRIVRDDSGAANPAEQAYLHRLLDQFSNLSIWDFKDTSANHSGVALHAKMVIIDRHQAIVGSANFSRNGMVENHELAIKLTGPEARSLALVCDRLVESGQRDGVLVQRKRDEP